MRAQQAFRLRDIVLAQCRSCGEQPLKLVVSITLDRAILWSISGLEGSLTSPKQVFQRTGRNSDACDGAYMCESNSCDAATQRCVPSRDDPAPVNALSYDQVYNQLSEERVNMRARRYLRDLRRDAVVDYR